MGVILQTSDYPSIRAALGVTTDDLPDADIDTIGLLPIAEAMVISLVSDYAAILTAGGTNKTFLQAATLNLCAMMCISKLEVQRGQAFKQGNYSESETKANWEDMRCQFQDQSKAYLMRISTHAHTRRTLFAATGPTSSHSNWPGRIDQWFARITPHIVEWSKTGGVILYGWENQP